MVLCVAFVHCGLHKSRKQLRLYREMQSLGVCNTRPYGSGGYSVALPYGQSDFVGSSPTAALKLGFSGALLGGASYRCPYHWGTREVGFFFITFLC